jgi:hypothetical protein
MQQDVSQWTLLTYPGISAVVIMLIGGIKKLWPTWVNGKEPHISLASCLILGIATKLTIQGAFVGVQWVPHIVALLGAAFGAKIGHDWLLNEIIKNKETK